MYFVASGGMVLIVKWVELVKHSCKRDPYFWAPRESWIDDVCSVTKGFRYFEIHSFRVGLLLFPLLVNVTTTFARQARLTCSPTVKSKEEVHIFQPSPIWVKFWGKGVDDMNTQNYFSQIFWIFFGFKTRHQKWLFRGSHRKWEEP